MRLDLPTNVLEDSMFVPRNAASSGWTAVSGEENGRLVLGVKVQGGGVSTSPQKKYHTELRGINLIPWDIPWDPTDGPH